MTPPFRPLLYAWGSILGAAVVGAAVLQVLGPPPHRERRSETAPTSAEPVGRPVVAAQAGGASVEAPPLASANPSPPVTVADVSPPASFDLRREGPAALQPEVPTITIVPAERDTRRRPRRAERAIRERDRAIVELPTPPAPPRVLLRSPEPAFLGVYVTDADGMRVFKPQP